MIFVLTSSANLARSIVPINETLKSLAVCLIRRFYDDESAKIENFYESREIFTNISTVHGFTADVDCDVFTPMVVHKIVALYLNYLS